MFFYLFSEFLIKSRNSCTVVVLPHKLMADQQLCTSVILGFSSRSLGPKLQLIFTILLVLSEKSVHYDLTITTEFMLWVSVFAKLFHQNCFLQCCLMEKTKKKRT